MGKFSVIYIIDKIKSLVPKNKNDPKVAHRVGFTIKHFHDAGCLEKVK